MTKERLNVGCGRVYLPGWVNCDINPRVKTDRMFDMNGPWPFPDDTIDEVLMDQVLEHAPYVERVLEELWRVLAPGGTATILVPYARSEFAVADPTHHHYFTEHSMDPFVFTKHAADFYNPNRFLLVKAALFCNQETPLQKWRNAIPFRPVLRYLFNNMYDGVRFELRKWGATYEPKKLNGVKSPSL